MSNGTFISKCLAGDANIEDVDAFVQAWHEGAGPGLELREFLGMSSEEYALWLEQPGALPAIVGAHRQGTSPRKVRKSQSASPVDAGGLKQREAS